MGERCCFCEKSSESLLQCSGCGNVQYCNQTCQRSDWKTHKKSCKVYKLVKISGKNYGLVATRSIKQGEIIMKENPLLIKDKNAGESEALQSLAEQFKNLSKVDQRLVLSLHHDNPDDTVLARVSQVFVSNACDVTAANATALYPTIPRMNHSCAPNVVWSWVASAPYVKEVRTTRAVALGEELCTNYIDSFQATFSCTRQRQDLLQRWKFVCQCEVCSLPDLERRQNDLLREKIFLQHQLIPKFMASWKVDKAVEAARTKLELMKSIENQMVTTIPSAILELYEMSQLRKVLKSCSDDDDECENLLKEAKERSNILGDRFVHTLVEKVQQIEQECLEVSLNRIKIN